MQGLPVDNLVSLHGGHTELSKRLCQKGGVNSEPAAAVEAAREARSCIARRPRRQYNSIQKGAEWPLGHLPDRAVGYTKDTSVTSQPSSGSTASTSPRSRDTVPALAWSCSIAGSMAVPHLRAARRTCPMHLALPGTTTPSWSRHQGW
jgi:hypothetical protein